MLDMLKDRLWETIVEVVGVPDARLKMMLLQYDPVSRRLAFSDLLRENFGGSSVPREEPKISIGQE